MEAHHRQLRRRDRRHRRHAALEPLRSVDHDVGETEIAQHVERPLRRLAADRPPRRTSAGCEAPRRRACPRAAPPTRRDGPCSRASAGTSADTAAARRPAFPPRAAARARRGSTSTRRRTARAADPSRRCAASPRARRAARRSIGSGSRATSVGCPVISACAFTWNTKSSGVRSAHSARDRALGERVVGGVHLHRRELARVVAQPVLARRHAARIEHAALGDRRIRPRRGADADLARVVRIDEERTADLLGGRGARARARRAPRRRRSRCRAS